MQVSKCHKILMRILASLFMLSLFTPAVEAAADHDSLFILIGNSLIKADNPEVITDNMNEFANQWSSVKTEGELANQVDQSLNDVREMLKGNEETQVKASLSALSSALVAYDNEQNPTDQMEGKENIKQLLPLIDELLATVTAGDYSTGKSQYDELQVQWNKAESVIREESVASYGEVETLMAYIRIAITQDPPDQEKAITNLNHLTTAYENFLAGNVKEDRETSYSLDDVSQLLTESTQSVEDDNIDEAVSHLMGILNIWPLVEGDVSTRDSVLYSDMETKIPSAISLLQSKKVQSEKAKEIIQDLYDRLLPLLSDVNYTTWDAALILLREGFEALLVVGTLLSFLRKMGQGDKQKWIWIGVIIGLLASVGLAIVMNRAFSQLAAATGREQIEGLTGVIAVIMMISVGVWLHSKSNINSWNRYIGKKMDQAVAAGSLVSFAMISFLSIFREGAEMIIFYSGMAPYMEVKQLLSGIAIALILLIGIGFIMIRFSVKMPITIFLKTATIFIYALAFKILGLSIHSLQVSQYVPTHSLDFAPFIKWAGIYPTSETLIPQAVLLAIIALSALFMRTRKSRKTDKKLPV